MWSCPRSNSTAAQLCIRGQAIPHTSWRGLKVTWALPPNTQRSPLGRWVSGNGRCLRIDLAESTVLFHQGRRDEASTGPEADADGDRMYKPTDMFVGFLDPQLTPFPQADLHQDALVRVLEWMAAIHAPLPRVWHFPDAALAVAFINGDGDGMHASDLASTIATCERFGAPYTAYLMMEDHPEVSPAWEAAPRERGHDFSQHGWAGPLPTPEEMRTRLHLEFDAFRSRYGHEGLTYRGHSVIWCGWSIPPAICTKTAFAWTPVSPPVAITAGGT